MKNLEGRGGKDLWPIPSIRLEEMWKATKPQDHIAAADRDLKQVPSE
jgi:hypothetical protein